MFGLSLCNTIGWYPLYIDVLYICMTADLDAFLNIYIINV